MVHCPKLTLGASVLSPSILTDRKVMRLKRAVLFIPMKRNINFAIDHSSNEVLFLVHKLIVQQWGPHLSVSDNHPEKSRYGPYDSFLGQIDNAIIHGPKLNLTHVQL